MPRTIDMHMDMTLSEVQQAFETAALLEGFHTRFRVCAFSGNYFYGTERSFIPRVHLRHDHIDLTEDDDTKWDLLIPDWIPHSELFIDYALNAADGTRLEPGRLTLVRGALRTSDVVDAYGLVIDPDDQDIVPDVFALVLPDHNLTIPFNAMSKIMLVDFSDGGVDHVTVVDRRFLHQLPRLEASIKKRAAFVAHPQGQQMVDLCMDEAILNALFSVEAQEGMNDESSCHFYQFVHDNPRVLDQTEQTAQTQPARTTQPSAQGAKPSAQPEQQESTPPQYQVEPFGPAAVYLLDDIRSKRPNKLLKQDCSYFSRMARGVKPSARELAPGWRHCIDLAYGLLTIRIDSYSYSRKPERKFILDFINDYPNLIGAFDLLGHHDWSAPERPTGIPAIDANPAVWIAMRIFGLVPIAALMQQLPPDHAVRKDLGKRIVRFENDHCVHFMEERYEIVRNEWLTSQIAYWSNLPSTAKPYQQRLRDDVLEAYIEIDTLLEQGWARQDANPEFYFLSPTESYLERALRAVVNTDPIRLDANAVRVLAACNVLVILKAMETQLDLTDCDNIVMPPSLRSLRYDAKWCMDTLQDPQKQGMIEFSTEEYFGRHFGSLLPYIFAKDWQLNNNLLSLAPEYDCNTPSRVIRTLCELVSAANAEDGRANPNDFFCAAGSEPQFMVRNLKNRYELDDVGRMTGLMGRTLVPGIGKHMSWVPERLM